jgi:two-component system, chemotaxis family, CheB/CheR fusion protein
MPLGPVDVRGGSSSFPIVGIGASAGGLDAYLQLLQHLGPDTGMAFVLVQHLDPRHESRLTELLARATPMPVTEASHGLAIQPNHVYVIPPNANLAVSRGVLQVTPRKEGRGPHLPVDFLFRSLAEDEQTRAIGVVLSGTGSDGTLGLSEIKAIGGITFAQDEETAGHSGMPRSAIDSGCVDFVLSPAQIAERLGEIGEHPYLAPDPTEPLAGPTAAESYQRILAVVQAVTGVDFRLYRDTTIKRRILRRMALHSQRSIGEYADRLKDDVGEVDALYHDLLINVTSFFRDSKMFEELKAGVFPQIVDKRSPIDPIRIWVPGCSTGQEAYSLAMALQEFLDTQPVRIPMQIFATDLSDQTALDKARAGVYPESIEAEVSPARLRRFFKREDHVYRIDRSIRDACVFARQNVTTDPPFSHLDIVSCRNLLIYLTTPLQKRVLRTFHYALDTPGFLILGGAETVGEHTDLFEAVGRGHRIYAKKQVTARHHALLPVSEQRLQSSPATPRTTPPAPQARDFQKEADRILLGRYAPPGVLVDDNFEILQFRGRIGAYLEPPAGEPTHGLLKMAREGLFLELRNAVIEARKTELTVRRDHIRVRSNDEVKEVDVEVIPVRQPGAGSCYLVLFHESGDGTDRPPVVVAARETPPAQDANELVQLSQELSATREYLQSMIEQQDAANEELRSANEEILSSNEELQSTNEELETAKEELQSANEELTTVNEQLQRRSAQVDLANNDLTNLLSSTSIPVVMVGGDLRVRRFTEPARTTMNLLPGDVGRPLTDLNVATIVPDLDQIISDVIDKVQPYEREVHDRDGRWHMMRVHPYRTSENKIDGAVIVLVDVDMFHRSQEALRQTTAQLALQGQLIELSQDAVIVRDAKNLVLSWNKGAEEMYGWTSNEAVGKTLHQLLRTDTAAWAALNEQLDQRGTAEGELRQVRKDGTPLIVQTREVLVCADDGTRTAVLSIKRNVTELRKMVEALKDADRRKDEFLAMLAHELRNPLGPIRNAVGIMTLAGNDPTSVSLAREMLERQVGQLGRIIDDLVDISRIVERKITLKKETVELHKVVEVALETCRSQIEGREHRLSVSLPAETLYLHGDPVRLSQVLINLLNNSARYTGQGGEIAISAKRVAADSRGQGAAGSPGDVVLRVRDSGIGISSELLPHVFDAFTQGDSVDHRGGLGVGLSIVQSLVEMHGGAVQASSEGPGKGSEFLVRLPLVEPPHDTKEAEQRGRQLETATRRRVLVVDDNSDHAESLAFLLKLMGHETRLAHDGEAALQVAAEFEPNVALIDIGLPRLNGYEVARRLREQPRLRNALLVAQTGWGQESDRARSHEAGFDHHLIKPVALEVLAEIIDSADRT